MGLNESKNIIDHWRRLVLLIVFIGSVLVLVTQVYAARAGEIEGQVLGTAITTLPDRFWEYQCIDTMKYSRDAAREWLKSPKMRELVEREIDAVNKLGANCVAVDTPYDEEFWPLLQTWIDRAHSRGLRVWLRGNMSGWEGWFGYKRFTDVEQHHEGVRKFVLANWKFFQSKDILTPAPEAENGHLMGKGNPFRTWSTRRVLQDFVKVSQENCEKAVKEAGARIKCGYFSANGDVAEQIYNSDIAQETGQVTMDHYVKTPARFIDDITRVAKTHETKVFVGEFGAPIPDIHGKMTESQQADMVEKLLNQLYRHKDVVGGVNYWVLRGGSTALLNPDLSERAAARVVRKYFKPSMIYGQVTDKSGRPVEGVRVSADGGAAISLTDAEGMYSLLVPGNKTELEVFAKGVKSLKLEVDNLSNTVPLLQKVKLK